MLAACKVVLQKINREDIYERHNTGSSKRADVTDFFEDLAKLSLEDQQSCFNDIVEFLKARGKGVEHVAERLVKGKHNWVLASKHWDMEKKETVPRVVNLKGLRRYM